MKAGLNRIRKDHRDYDFHKTFGSATVANTASLPSDFSIDPGLPLPNQDMVDRRFTPSVRALPFGCTAETTTYLGACEDGRLYKPDDLYDHTAPGTDGVGRDIRKALQASIDRGFMDSSGILGYQRTGYFNVQAAGPLDWFDAVRVALWINQQEKRAVSVGTWWYGDFAQPQACGILPIPGSFDTINALLHNHAICGWKTIGGDVYLDDVSWQGQDYGMQGHVYISRALFNALMSQPYTGAFTISKVVPGAVQTVDLSVISTFVSWFLHVILKI